MKHALVSALHTTKSSACYSAIGPSHRSSSPNGQTDVYNLQDSGCSRTGPDGYKQHRLYLYLVGRDILHLPIVMFWCHYSHHGHWPYAVETPPSTPPRMLRVLREPLPAYDRKTPVFAASSVDLCIIISSSSLCLAISTSR
jgi:hypothetical protein